MVSPRAKRTEKLQLMLNEEELQIIEDWRFDNRMPSRAEAIRALVRRGLETAADRNPAVG
ncbi:MAG: hypothetical protein RLO50_01150 [Azospirillaceae bacterium]